MRVFVTGATGFLGRALTLALRREGHSVVAWVRSEDGARACLGDQAELMTMAPAGEDEAALCAALERCDAVINLAGEPILSRWSPKRREQLRASRIGLTKRLVDAIESIKKRPRVFLSGSAIGIYGDRGDESLDESSERGTGFLAELCTGWEAAGKRAESLGVRTVLIRTGIVLGIDGGAMVSMLPPFRLGLGGRMGSGRQAMSWIHVEDWAALLCAALHDERFRGPINATAPHPATNREFTRILATTLRRPAIFPIPAIALNVLFGSAASILLESQRVLPAIAQKLGFRFRFPTLKAALHDLLVAGRPTIRRWSEQSAAPRHAAASDSTYLERRPPAFELDATTELAVPLAEAFKFFSAPENLGLLTPRAMHFRIESRSGVPAAGSTIDYRIRVGPLPLRWRTRFESWQVNDRFVDVQESGPYRAWWHEHRFEARDGATRMSDRVLYTPPFGVLGRIANRLLISDQLGDIFAQRSLAIRLRFAAA